MVDGDAGETIRMILQVSVPAEDLPRSCHFFQSGARFAMMNKTLHTMYPFN